MYNAYLAYNIAKTLSPTLSWDFPFVDIRPLTKMYEREKETRMFHSRCFHQVYHQ